MNAWKFVRYTRIICSVYWIISLLLLSWGAFASESRSSFTFVQIADTQLGFSTGNNDLTPEIENFRKAVSYINKLKPAFVVISGDMVHAAHNPKQIRAFWQVAREISSAIPVYFVAGNHDIGKPTEVNVRSYEKLFGKDHYSFSHNGSWFVVLNSCIIKEPTVSPDIHAAQRKWFEEELESISRQNPRHIFVLSHHPWFINTPDEKDQYFNIPQTQRKDFLDVMKRYGVDYAVAGHYHQEASGKNEGLSMITTSALSKGLGKDPVGFRIFRVYSDHVEHTYHTLDKLEELK